MLALSRNIAMNRIDSYPYELQNELQMYDNTDKGQQMYQMVSDSAKRIRRNMIKVQQDMDGKIELQSRLKEYNLLHE